MQCGDRSYVGFNSSSAQVTGGWARGDGCTGTRGRDWLERSHTVTVSADLSSSSLTW